MSRYLVLFLLGTLTGPAWADDSVSVPDLVKQLGDAKFARREAAHKELLRRGEGVVPELDRLAKTADAETADRIGKVRYALVGYKEDIRRLLADVHEGLDSGPVPVSDELRGLIVSHQPGSGDLLVSILARLDDPLRRRTLRAFVSTWDLATPDQIDRYIQQAVSLKTSHRAKFPAKVGAMISFEAQVRDGWTGWPQPEPKGFTFKTRTTRYLDGKPYERPYEYRYPFATVGWYRVAELAEGKHTIHAALEYEITQNGQTRNGTIRSKDSTFAIQPADTADELIAPKSVELAAAFRRSFIVHDGGQEVIERGYDKSAVSEIRSDWHPQVSWQGDDGKWHGLSCPTWVLKDAMPSHHLCFDVEIKDVKAGKTYAADPICVRAAIGRESRGYIYPREVRTFAADREGFVTVKVVMKPSRAVALTNPDVIQYFPEPFESDELRIRVVTAATQARLFQLSVPPRSKN